MHQQGVEVRDGHSAGARRLPSLGSVIKSMISEESLVRPSYTGTGIIHLEASMGGYYTFDLAGESWILENGAYWASDGGWNSAYFESGPGPFCGPAR